MLVKNNSKDEPKFTQFPDQQFIRNIDDVGNMFKAPEQ